MPTITGYTVFDLVMLWDQWDTSTGHIFLALQTSSFEEKTCEKAYQLNFLHTTKHMLLDNG